MTPEQVVDTFAHSIAHYEGFFLKKSLAKRNNNPGNLRSWGQMPVINGFAVFPTSEAGWQALRAQCEKNIFKRKLTFKEFFAGKPKVYGGYAPAADNNEPQKYASYVAAEFGIKNIDTVIESLAKEKNAPKEN